MCCAAGAQRPVHPEGTPSLCCLDWAVDYIAIGQSIRCAVVHAASTAVAAFIPLEILPRVLPVVFLLLFEKAGNSERLEAQTISRPDLHCILLLRDLEYGYLFSTWWW